jgi:glycine/D-amino acid oxidase-like deaminating enzyme
MHSQRGLINLFHSDGQRDAFARRGNAMINQGDDAELLDREGRARHLPYLDFEQTRFPIYGGLLHRRGGTARHDAVAWGYARGADHARRRSDPELRSHRHRHRKRHGARRADHTRRDPRQEGGRSSSRAAQARWRRWRACACRSKATSCRPS